MLVALTGDQKFGLALVAAIFIAFALASAFVLPRWRPDFPGAQGLKFFVAITVVLVVAMLGAIVFLAKEGEEAGAEGREVATETRAADTATGEEAQQRGDAEAGAEVYASAGCGGCHTLEEAGSSGNVGPNLDESQPDKPLVVDRVRNGKGLMPAFRDELSEEQIQNVAAYVVGATG